MTTSTLCFAIFLAIIAVLPSPGLAVPVKIVKRDVNNLAWSDIPIIEDQIHFVFNLGPTGGNIRGYSAIRGISAPDNDLVFYVNGLLSPDIHLVRNTTYYFFPLTGTDYPVYITSDPDGGYAYQDNRRRQQTQVYGGLDNYGLPLLVGLNCVYVSNITQQNTDQLPAYANFFATLNLQCSQTDNRSMATYFTWTPDANTPAIVYYQSYSKPRMGGKFLITNTEAKIQQRK